MYICYKYIYIYIYIYTHILKLRKEVGSLNFSKNTMRFLTTYIVRNLIVTIPGSLLDPTAVQLHVSVFPFVTLNFDPLC